MVSFPEIVELGRSKLKFSIVAKRVIVSLGLVEDEFGWDCWHVGFWVWSVFK